MNKDLVSIGDVYGKMLNTFKHENHLNEAAAKPFENAFSGKKNIDGKGPDVDGYHEALDDDKGKKPMSSKKKKTKAKKETFDDDQEIHGKIHGESKKSAGRTLNNFMSKSVFDKLYNKVLKENFGQEESDDELGALGLGDDATPDSEMDEFGDEGEGEDSVTFTLPREVAQQLVDVLQGVLGDVEDELGDDEGLDFEDEGGDEFGDEGGDEFGFEEDEEVQGTKEFGDKSKVYQGPTKSNKVTPKVSPKSGKASSAVTDTVGTKEGAPPITALQGKNNKVPGKVSVGDFFK